MGSIYTDMGICGIYSGTLVTLRQDDKKLENYPSRIWNRVQSDSSLYE